MLQLNVWPLSVAAFVHQPVIYLWRTPWHFRQSDSWGTLWGNLRVLFASHISGKESAPL